MLSTEMKCLQSMPLFRDVDIAKLKLVTLAGVAEEYPATETIARMGEPSEAVYIVIEGEVEILRETEEATVPIARMGRGYIIGDIAVILGEPYPASFVAVTPVEVLRLDAEVFMQLVRDVPQLSLALMKDLGRRVIKLSTNYIEALK
jgi:CRP-like cAMP-binding protein